MGFLKKIWPFSFDTENVNNLILKAIIYTVIAVIMAVVMSTLKSVPIIGILFAIIGTIVELYTVIGLVLLFLTFFKVLK